jgi:regulatory protein
VTTSRKLSASDPFSTALRLLARCERSSADLRERLRRRGFAEAAIAAAVQRCTELGYLDDARYARLRARSLVAGGRAVGTRLRQDLLRHGIAAEEADAAIAEAGGDGADENLLAALLERRYPDFSWAAADDRQRRRVTGFFLRRGFPLALVLSVLKQNRER